MEGEETKEPEGDEGQGAEDVSANKEAKEMAADEKRQEQKKQLKKMFDAEYDETSKYYNELKDELDQQAKVRSIDFFCCHFDLLILHGRFHVTLSCYVVKGDSYFLPI